MEPLPETFVQRIKSQLGDEAEAFFASLRQPPPVSIRFSRKKARPSLFTDFAPEPVRERDKNAVLWCEPGQYLPERPIFTLDPRFHAGGYYVQEASSMRLWSVLDHLSRSIGAPRCILDLCAAPGGKTTLLADLQQEPGPNYLLVANDAIRSRIGPLKENLIRWGNPGVLLANHDPEDFAGTLPGFFDLVLVDAPCSGEGMFRKDPGAIREWSPRNAELCAARQRRILTAAHKLVQEGGLLLYSTCTYNPEENDGSVRFLKNLGGYTTVDLSGLLPPEDRTEEGWQLWPHRVRGEGFYFAVLRREGGSGGKPLSRIRTAGGQALPPVGGDWESVVAQYLQEPDAFTLRLSGSGSVVALPANAPWQTVIDHLPRVQPLLSVGVPKGREFIPAHPLALSTARNRKLPQVILDREQALCYLRKEPFNLPEDSAQGWVIAAYQGAEMPLGWLKVMPDRFNNYLPTEWRIRMSG